MRFMHCDRLITLRDIIIRQPLISAARFLELAQTISEKDEVHQRLLDEVINRKDSKKEKGSHLDPRFKKPVSTEKLQEMNKELNLVLKRLEYLETHEEESPSDSTSSVNLRTEIAGGKLVSMSPYGRIEVGSSPSSKLNYIINEARPFLINYLPLQLNHSAYRCCNTHLRRNS